MLPHIYFLKVIICSAIFMGYYYIALRNKIYHQYNRFYLLFAAISSWIIPLLNFQIFVDEATTASPVYTAISYMANDGGVFEPEIVSNKIAPQFSMNDYILFGYMAFSVLFIVVTVFSIAKIILLTKKYPKQAIDNYSIYFTNAKDAPFSFFKLLFWNTDININSSTGQQILQHELTHIRQRHSWDKIFIQLNIIAGWFNPFFWLIKKELAMIHEFIADKKSVPAASVQEFAAMLLNTAFGTPKTTIANPFFFSPIKRRLLMLTKNKTPRFSYVQRMIALPLLIAAVILFSLKVNADNNKPNPLYKKGGGVALSKKYKIVIDAGHGGVDKGAASADGNTYEKDIVLALAKIIKEKNSNGNIEIVLTREDDAFMHVKEKAEFSNNQNADLFVSLHCNNIVGCNTQKASGMEFYVVNAEKNNGYRSESEQAALHLNNTLSRNFKSNGISTRKTGIWVLQATKCPGVLIEAGYINNNEDLKILADKDKQAQMATDILQGIENFLKNKEDKNSRYEFNFFGTPKPQC